MFPKKDQTNDVIFVCDFVHTVDCNKKQGFWLLLLQHVQYEPW